MDLPPEVQAVIDETLIVENVSASHVKSYVPSPVALTHKCLLRVSDRFNIPLSILSAIRNIENGQAGHYRVNSNNSIDVGPFQINSVHFKRFSKLGVTAYRLRWDGCVNAAAAGYLLKSHYDKAVHNGDLNNWDDFLKTTANYHSFTEEYNVIYQGKLIRSLAKSTESHDEARATEHSK